MAEIKVRMVIDPFRTVGNALSCAKKLKLPRQWFLLTTTMKQIFCMLNLSTQKSLIMTLLTIKDLSPRL